MTLVQLTNFIRIAELQSLSKAAAVIRVAQPALSRQIKMLELELGTPLLVRHAWGVTLTSAGLALLEHAKEVVRLAESARDAVLEVASVPSGSVALGIPSSLASALIPPLSLTLQEKYPRLRVHFVDGFSATLHKRTLAEELDLAILYEDGMIGPLSTAPLLSESLVLVGPADAVIDADHPEAVLKSNSLILPATSNRLRMILDEAFGLGDGKCGPIIEVDSLPAIIEIVKSGGGFTVLPFSSVAAAAVRGDIRTWELGDQSPSRTLLLVRSLNRHPTVAVNTVEQEVRDLVIALAKAMEWNALCD